MSIEDKLGWGYNKCSTALNLSAVLSCQGLHEEAMHLANSVVKYLLSSAGDSMIGGSKEEQISKSNTEINLLAIALFNLGVEQEHLMMYSLAIQSYEKSKELTIARQDDPFVSTINRAINVSKRKKEGDTRKAVEPTPIKARVILYRPAPSTKKSLKMVDKKTPLEIALHLASEKHKTNNDETKLYKCS
jgi:hypothetical protein